MLLAQQAQARPRASGLDRPTAQLGSRQPNRQNDPDMSDLVVLSLEAWDTTWRRNQHLVAGLLAADPGLRVLFVEPSADPLSDLRRRRRPALPRHPRPVAPADGRLFTHRPIKALPRRIDPHADDRLAAQTMRAAGSLGMRHPVLWINDPSGAALLRRTRWRSLYDVTDDWTVAERSGRALSRIVADDAFLIESAEAVVVCSAELQRRKASQRGHRTPPVLIPNGVDAAAYQARRPRPADLPAGACALYAGTLHRDRLDVELCAATARALAGRASVTLVGPNALGDTDTRLLGDAGVVILGARPHDRIPAYLQHADVLLVPHRVSAFTDSLDPIKLYEYQAVAAPVVSTPVSGFRDWNDPRVVIAEDADFPPAVVAALDAPRPAAAPAAMLSDWSVRVRAMGEVIATLRG
jgi:teichuronic acid biosynthesis glycosyltransferase TuaH